MRRATDLPLMVKMSPAATDVRGIAKAIADAGADAISAVNTLPGMAIDRHRRKPLLGNVYGGLSGPALKPVALRVVYEVAQVVKIPIVAIGGIGSLDDVLDFLYRRRGRRPGGHGRIRRPGPAAPPRRRAGRVVRARTAYATHREVVGAALPERRSKPSVKGVEYRP